MKKLLASLLFSVALLAQQAQFLSPVPLPSNTIVDLDPMPYDRYMLEEALRNGQIFTFLAKYEPRDDEELRGRYEALAALFRVGPHARAVGGEFRIAFLLAPTKIGKYAASTTATALAYLTARKAPFSMKLYRLEEESAEAIQSRLEQIASEGYGSVVAPLTEKGVSVLCSLDLSLNLFVPTVRGERVGCDNPLVTFGGIDYLAQIDVLSRLEEPQSKTFVVVNHSALSRRLGAMTTETTGVDGTITLGAKGYYKSVIEKYPDLNQSTLYLHTPVVKSSLFLSQLTLADFKPAKVLSTQLNYSPLLLTLTQYHDRENMTVASSIGKADPFVVESVALAGSDVRFNWLNYATLVGVDLDYSQKTGESRVTTEGVTEGSVDYEISLYDAGLYRFIPRAVPFPPEEEREETEPEETPYSPLSQTPISE